MKTNFKADIVYHLENIHCKGDFWIAGFDIRHTRRR